MTVTLGDIIRRVRDRVDEPVAALWTDTQLTDYINDGLRDIARRAEDLQTLGETIAVAAGTAKYPLPDDVIRVHRVEFVPTGSNQTYIVQHSTYQEMDQIWGINQATQSSYPSFFVIWGYPGGVGASAHQIQFYPVPAQNGQVNLFYYRQPSKFSDPLVTPSEYNRVAEVVDGWDDLVVDFAHYQALKKDRDPSWKDFKVEYEEKVQQLVDVTRQWHDQQRMIRTASGANMPSWLYEGEGW